MYDNFVSALDINPHAAGVLRLYTVRARLGEDTFLLAEGLTPDEANSFIPTVNFDIEVQRHSDLGINVHLYGGGVLRVEADQAFELKLEVEVRNGPSCN